MLDHFQLFFMLDAVVLKWHLILALIITALPIM